MFKVILCAVWAFLVLVFIQAGWSWLREKILWFVLTSVFICSSVFALERTSVVRHPNGTSGSITNITVTVKFHEYTGGFGSQSYKVTWTENTSSGALVGNRSMQIAAFGSSSWGTAFDVTATWAGTWVSRFNASAAVEDPDNYSGWNTSPSPLNGAPWFTPPNDTVDYVWSTGNRGPEDPPAGDWSYPAASGEYWPYIKTTTGAGTLTEPAWPSTSVGVVPVHCRAVRAYVRVSNDTIGNRYVALVWDEVVSDEVNVRYCAIFCMRVGFPWNASANSGSATTRMPSQTTQLAGANAFAVTARHVYLNAGSQSETSIAPFDASSFGLGVVAGTTSSNRQDYRSVISRFRAAYLRDHGVSTDVVMDAFQNTAALAYYPEMPTGARAFAYEVKADASGAGATNALNNTVANGGGVPLFDRCDDPGSGTGGGAGGSTGPTASEIGDAVSEALGTGLAVTSGEGALSEGMDEPSTLGVLSTVQGWAYDVADMFPTEYANHEFAIPFWLPGYDEVEYVYFNTLPEEDTAADYARILLRGLLTAFCGVKLLLSCYSVIKTVPK